MVQEGTSNALNITAGQFSNITAYSLFYNSNSRNPLSFNSNSLYINGNTFDNSDRNSIFNRFSMTFNTDLGIYNNTANVSTVNNNYIFYSDSSLAKYIFNKKVKIGGDSGLQKNNNFTYSFYFENSTVEFKDEVTVLSDNGGFFMKSGSITSIKELKFNNNNFDVLKSTFSSDEKLSAGNISFTESNLTLKKVLKEQT